jgi:hypothetical protein
VNAHEAKDYFIHNFQKNDFLHLHGYRICI